MKLDKKWAIYLLVVLLCACSGNDYLIPNLEVPVVELKDGLNYGPAKPDADKELKITFRAPSNSPLYGYTGDVYIYIGILSEDVWQFVPAAWNVNIDKCKMTIVR